MMTSPQFSGLAKIIYGTPDYMITEPGAYVLCAVTGEQIPLEELRYWSEDLQEAYSSAEASFARWKETQGR